MKQTLKKVLQIIILLIKSLKIPIVVEVNSTVSDKEVKELFANIFLNTKNTNNKSTRY